MKKDKTLKILSFLSAFLIFITALTPTYVMAVPEADEEITEEEKSPEFDQSGRPILPPNETAILIDGATGVVLYEKGSSAKMYPASTTKIMTCLIAAEAIEKGEVTLEENITITKDMLRGLPIDGSSMGLLADEVISFDALLKGLMIPSGNDAAMAIAFRLSGGLDQFVQRMNNRALEMGLTNTHFENPHGLHHENHYTTAAELAKIAMEAMKHPIFRNIVDIAHIKIPPTNKTPEERYYINTNGLLSTMRYVDYFYKGTTGIKTGRTTEAGNCLVASVKKGAMELISVVLGAKDVTASHNDSIKIFDYGFNNYVLVKAIPKGDIVGQADVKWGRGKDTVTLSAKNDIFVVLPKGTDTSKLETSLNQDTAVFAPVAKGQDVCTATVYLDDTPLNTGVLIADTTIKRSFFWPIFAVGDWLWSLLLIRLIVYLILIALACLVFLIILGLILDYQKKKKRQRRRRYGMEQNNRNPRNLS